MQRLALNDDGYPYILPLNFDGGMTVSRRQTALGRAKVGPFEKDNRVTFRDELRIFRVLRSKGYCTMHTSE